MKKSVDKALKNGWEEGYTIDGAFGLVDYITKNGYQVEIGGFNQAQRHWKNSDKHIQMCVDAFEYYMNTSKEERKLFFEEEKGLHYKNWVLDNKLSEEFIGYEWMR